MKHNKSKHASTAKYTTTKLTQKTEARFGLLLQPMAWKWRQPIPDSALVSLTYLLRHLPTNLQPLDPQGAIKYRNNMPKKHQQTATIRVSIHIADNQYRPIDTLVSANCRLHNW